jgi:hypothetical protein
MPRSEVKLRAYSLHAPLSAKGFAMKIARLIGVVTFLAGLSACLGLAQDLSVLARQLEGAKIIAQDDANTYLGSITNKFDDDSIFNKFGDHGSKFADESIWNKFSDFGGELGAYSPFNKLCDRPPALVKGGRVIGYLTVNKTVTGAISPHVVQALAD